MFGYEKQMELIITEAMKKLKVIKFYYSDKTKKNADWRTVEPYLIGINKTTDKMELRGWFLPTEQQKINGEKEGWRLFIIERIENLQTLMQSFTPYRPDYNPNDKAMKIILNKL